MRYAVTAVLVAIFLLLDAECLLDMPLIERMLAYPFFHANVWHLAVNCLSVWLVFPPSRKDNMKTLLVSYIVSTLVLPLAPRPVAGISNLIYAAIGMRTPPFSSAWWRKPEVLVFLGVTVIMVFFRQFAGVTHIAAFLAGIGIAAVRRYNKRITDDIRRAAHS